MAFWRAEPKTPVRPSFWVYGKVPWAGDFVRFGALDAAGEALIDWIERSLLPAEQRVKTAWGALFDTGAPHGFVFRPPQGSNSGAVLIGVLAPSRDAVGRRFPILAGASLPAAALAGSSHLLPLAFGDFLERGLATIDTLRESPRPIDLEAFCRNVPLPQTELLAAAGREYDGWAQQTAADSAWAAVFRRQTLVTAENALALVMSAAQPWRGQEQPNTRLALRVPLGIGGSAAACFWLDVVRRALQWKKTVPTSFWTADEQAGSLLVHLGEVPETSYAELWVPDPDSDTVCDLCVVPARRTPLQPELAKVFACSTAPISELLRSL